MGDTTVDLDFKTMQQVAACGYEPIERKGRGTYGYVYEVGDVRGDVFAFKYILPDASYEREGLDSLNEIDILSRVHHPHIIHAARVITTHNCKIEGLAIVLPLADRTLYDTITDVTMTTARKLPILYRLATALQFLHRSHILHLDIKSSNVVLQEDMPYFIDFGLSMVVDNATVGKYNDRVRVTIDHRAPEILAGGRVYNAAVDVWAFGIMMLYVLSGKSIFPTVDWNTITTRAFHDVVIATFNNPVNIRNLLINVSPKYQDLCIDLLTHILQIDPIQRITASDIVNHPVFNEFKVPIDGHLEIPRIAYDYAADHRDILKLIIHWALALYANSRAELLFLAVDLFARTSSFYKERTPRQRISLAATCLWVAAKLTDAPLFPLNVYVPEIQKLVPELTAQMILQDEIELIHLLSGVLNVSNLYFSSTTGDELKLSYSNIIIARDSTLYARTDIPVWIATMKQLIPTPAYPNKNITIKDLIA